MRFHILAYQLKNNTLPGPSYKSMWEGNCDEWLCITLSTVLLIFCPRDKSTYSLFWCCRCKKKAEQDEKSNKRGNNVLREGIQTFIGLCLIFFPRGRSSQLFFFKELDATDYKQVRAKIRTHKGVMLFTIPM